MKKIMKHIITFYIIMLIACVLGGCNNSEVTPSIEVDSLITEQAAVPQRATLSLSAEISTSRSAMPDMTVYSFGKFMLYVNDSKLGLDSNNTGLIGLWDSYTAMCDTTLDVEIGEWTFTLSAYNGGTLYKSVVTKTLQPGSNSITFELLEAVRTPGSGEGDLSIVMNYDVADVGSGVITGGLYNMNEDIIYGHGDIELDKQEQGSVQYSLNGLPCGEYIVMFKVYADTEKKQLRSIIKELAVIFSNKTSTSTITANLLGKVYNITYQKNGGTFNSGYTPNTKFTRFGAAVELPTENEIKKSGYDFKGWYDNAAFTGSVVSEIPLGSLGNRTLYAKWRKKIKITFNPKGGTIAGSVSTQSVSSDESTDLITASELGLTNGNKRFFGWDTSTQAETVVYEDGGIINVNNDTTLYAVWSYSSISGSTEDNKDTDGDGLTDYEEVNTWHTDPTNKDTDGDGWTDAEEIRGLYNSQLNIFDPRIADVPQIDVVIMGQPIIDFVYSKGSTHAETVSQTLTDGNVSSRSNSQSNGKTSSTSHSHSLTFGVSVDHSWGQVGIGNFLGFQNKTTVKGDTTNSVSGSNGDSYTFSRNESESFSRNISNGKTSSDTTSRTWTGGRITILAKFRNPGNIAYTVDKMNVSITRTPNNRADFDIPVAAIELSSVGTIPPGGETGQFVLKKDLSVSETEELLKWSNAINVRIAGYSITIQKSADSNAKNDFTGALTRVKNQCASIDIDYGPNSGFTPESYLVSTKYRYNTNAVSAADLYTYPSLLDILETVLGLSRSSGKLVLKSDGRIQSIRGLENIDTPESANEPIIHGSWFITRRYTDENMQTVLEAYQMAYNVTDPEQVGKVGIDKIIVHPRDEVNIFFSVDQDGDGLPKRLEVERGTSDENPDTDGDGLTDFEEVCGWYNKDGNHTIIDESKYHANRKCYSNPNNKDTDGDEFDDDEDTDPIVPWISDLAEIKSAKYSTVYKGTLIPFQFSGTTASLSGLNEYIYLDIEPKLLFSQKHYRLSEKDEWKLLDEKQQIKLAIGDNNIFVQITAPNGKTKKVFTVKVNSVMPAMTGFNLISSGYTGGEVIVNWNGYKDPRMNPASATPNPGETQTEQTSDAYNKYILALRQGSVPMDKSSYYPTKSDAAGAVDYKSETKYPSSVRYLSVKPEVIEAGTLKVTVKPETLYTIGLFACRNTNNNDTYAAQYLAHDTVTSSREKEGTLTLYVCYFRDLEDEDGSPESEFYWEVHSDIFPDANTNLKVDDTQPVSMDAQDSKMEFYCFECKRTHKATGYDHYIKYTKKFSRMEDHKKAGHFSLDIHEHDSGSHDDDLGEMKIEFNYDHQRDVWTVGWDWFPIIGRYVGSKEVHNNEGMVKCSIKHSSDAGEGEFGFGVSWE
ncbi:MAG: InlB B-repeat-containing protein [Spirochaetales bacterium]|nr:InlB B-repeat-containing protein [Spirochaetales bacterium]